MCTGIENNIHYLLKFPRFASHRQTLFNSVYPIISKLFDVTMIDDTDFEIILLYGNKDLNFVENRAILEATIYFILNSKRFADE